MIVILALQDKYGQEEVQNIVPEPQIAATSTSESVDVVDAAKEDLERINAELDAEEVRLLEDIERAETRLREIENVRASLWKGSAVERLIVQAFPEDSKTALAIATCESGLDPQAYNPHNRDGSVDRGLFQINSVHDAALDRMGLNPWNVEDNVEFSRHLYDQRGGWGDWVCYWKRMHVAYL